MYQSDWYIPPPGGYLLRTRAAMMHGMRIRLSHLVATAAVATLVSAVPAMSAEPPNQNDPCGKAGRNTCGTTGVGSYQRYRYGLRWFGDYRGAIPSLGRVATFCLDLRYWYPGKQFAYREIDPPVFRNREGATISERDLAKMSYAIWNYGRSNTTDRQAATMLYVHGLMRDGAPGEVAKDAVGARVESVYDDIARDAQRLRGPYRVQMSMASRLTVAQEATVAVKVVSATGAPMSGVDVTLDSDDVTGLAGKVRTNAKGVATATFTPGTRGQISINARTEPLAAPRPKLFQPSTAAASRNGQRLAAPQGEAVEQSVARPVGRGSIAIRTRAFPTVVPTGGNSRDRVSIIGGSAGIRATIGVKLFGPFRTKAQVVCTGTPAAAGQVSTDGRTVFSTDPVKLDTPGWYSYQMSVPDSPQYEAFTTPCGEPSETFRVIAKPVMTSQVNKERVRPNEGLTTAVTVKGLTGETAPITVELFGPYPTREAMSCQGPAIQTQTLTATGDGTYTTPPVTLTTPGFYVFRESISGNELVEKSEIACGDPLETAIVVGSPKVVTQVSAQETTPGGTIHDTLVVTGLGSLTATVNVELYGPYESTDQMVCSGPPAWSGTVEAKGDGTYTTPEVRLTKVGYYTYRERISEMPQNDAHQGECGVAAETTIAKANPEVVTQASSAVLRPGDALFDRLKVTGAGTTPLQIELALYGPFATKAAMRCTGTPYWHGTVDAAKGDGTYASEPVRIQKAGFYTYRERIAGSAFVTATQGQCGEAAETSLGAPAIQTGRAPVPARPVRQAQGSGDAPTRVTVAALGINAPVSAVGIDVAAGELNAPDNIARTGWWRDGAAPGDGNGSVLIAGHVDSARRGPGAFFRLKDARAGMRVAVTAGGRTHTYRVTSVRTMPKAALPLNVYSVTGRERLTLVTCGGPFDRAIGHYRDNVVVTAVRS